MISNPFRLFSRRSNRGVRRARTAHQLPVLDALEDRALLSLSYPPNPTNWVPLGRAPIDIQSQPPFFPATRNILAEHHDRQRRCRGGCSDRWRRLELVLSAPGERPKHQFQPNHLRKDVHLERRNHPRPPGHVPQYRFPPANRITTVDDDSVVLVRQPNSAPATNIPCRRIDLSLAAIGSIDTYQWRGSDPCCSTGCGDGKNTKR